MAEQEEIEELEDDVDELKQYHQEDAATTAADVVVTVSSSVSRLIETAVLYLTIALALFLAVMLFELVYPFMAPPELLYSKTQVILVYVQQYWNFAAAASNLFLGAFDFVIPLWNSLSMYWVQPTVNVIMEAVGLVLMGDPNRFYVLSNANQRANPTGDPNVPPVVPWKGFSCDAGFPAYPIGTSTAIDPRVLGHSAAAWCGLYGAYQIGVTGNRAALKERRRLQQNGGNYVVW